MIFVVVVVAVGVVLLFASARIANQYQRAVVFRLGKFNRVSGPGLYFLIPLVEWQDIVDLRTMTANVEEQECITRDNVPIKVNAVLWYRVVDPRNAIIEVKGVANAVIQVSVTTLRTVLGQHTLDDVL